MKQIQILFIIGILALIMGCQASITRYGYKTNDLKTNVSSCDGIVIKNNAKLSPDMFEVIGSIKASDTQFSTECSEEYVLAVFRKDACALCANIINIVEEKHPNFMSTCYQAKAELIRIKDRSLLADMTSDSQYSSELIKERSARTAIGNAAAGGAIGGVAGAFIMSKSSSTGKKETHNKSLQQEQEPCETF